MNDSEFGKKEVESMDLDYFLDAYKLLIGDAMRVVVYCESPDFVCQRQDGELVGIEVTEVHPREPYDATAEIYRLWSKHRANYPVPTMLVLSLWGCHLGSSRFAFDDYPIEDFDEGGGFSEIWVADYTELEAFSSVELYGLYPEHVRGYYPYSERGKPYG